MKKVLSNSKLSTTTKLVRRVLSRTSNASSREDARKSQKSTSDLTKNQQEVDNLELELTSLKEQTTILKSTINNMQDDAEQKEKVLATLAKEKQQLLSDLEKEKRSTSNLKLQLQDEREFYFKEKQQYCKEMHTCKKLKKKLSKQLVDNQRNRDDSELLQCKRHISKLEEVLQQALEANYNLSVKFLRMKNTKLDLKKRLERNEVAHKKAMDNLEIKVGDIKNELVEIVDKRFTLPISPSNKKYLQVIKQNGILMYDNLCLQMEIDRLSTKIDNLNLIQERNYSKEKLKLLHGRKNKAVQTNYKSKNGSELQTKSKHKTSQRVIKSILSTENNSKTGESNPKVVTIFERKEAPLTTENVKLTDSLEKSKLKENNSALITLHENEIISPSTSRMSSQFCNGSSVATHSSSHDTLRTQSAPEIVQTSLFVSKSKP